MAYLFKKSRAKQRTSNILFTKEKIELMSALCLYENISRDEFIARALRVFFVIERSKKDVLFQRERRKIKQKNKAKKKYFNKVAKISEEREYISSLFNQ
ncbi:hypothetical protein [Campylobacter sp. VTCC 70190]|uniref:hypothetical protein n=1 Tax=Campylobacter sp. VTCC 70190 TaxID=3392118 RepID=UPI00398F0811